MNDPDTSWDQQLPPWDDKFIVPGPRIVLYDSKGKPMTRAIGYIKQGEKDGFTKKSK